MWYWLAIDLEKGVNSRLIIFRQNYYPLKDLIVVRAASRNVLVMYVERFNSAK